MNYCAERLWAQYNFQFQGSPSLILYSKSVVFLWFFIHTKYTNKLKKHVLAYGASYLSDIFVNDMHYECQDIVDINENYTHSGIMNFI